MKLFNKLCLMVGKIVVFTLTFLTCFYMIDLVCTAIKPVINALIKWGISNQKVLIISSFGLFAIVFITLYLIADNRYKEIFKRN